MIAGRQFWLWRAVDDEGEVLDLLVQRRRDKAAAVKLMRKLLKKQGFAPDVLVTDKLGAAFQRAFKSRMGMTPARWRKTPAPTPSQCASLRRTQLSKSVNVAPATSNAWRPRPDVVLVIWRSSVSSPPKGSATSRSSSRPGPDI